MQGNQLFGPYGNGRYGAGTINTAKGFIGQYNDSLTGLDYFHARYYDPVAGVFLSADKVQGNWQGMDPYGYVDGNPETRSDPTGQMFIHAGSDDGTQNTLQSQQVYDYHYVTSQSLGESGLPALLDAYLYHHDVWVQAESYAQLHLHTSTRLLLGMEAISLIHSHAMDWNATDAMRRLFMQINALALPVVLSAAGLGLEGGEIATMEDLERVAAESEQALTAHEQEDEAGGCYSFTPSTPVTTDHGKQSIGTLHAGEKVWAYNPRTHKMELEAILHVWISHDNDLADLTLTPVVVAQHGKAALKTSEVIHTNKKHPFLTEEQGFLPVGQIKLGMHVLRADGTYGIVTGWKAVPGTQVMYNLEVAHDHTYTVGAGQWVVHNSQCTVKDLHPLHTPATSGSRPDLEKLSDQELLESVYNPKDGRYIRINPNTGKIMDGNGRAYELLRRAGLPNSSITPDTPIYYEPYVPSSIPDPWEEPPD